MPVNMPNLGAVNAMGKQFTGNIFEKTAGRALARTKLAGKRAVASRHAEAHARATQMPAQPEKTFSPAPPGTKLAEDAVSAGRARRQASAGYTPPSGASGHSAPNFNPTARQQNMPNNGLNQAPAPVHAAPSFASSKPKHAAPSFGGATAASTPHPVHQTSSAQFEAPSSPSSWENASSTYLKTLSDNHSSPGKPNNFTHQSNKKNASSQGIGNMGAKLEAGLSSRPFGTAPTPTAPAKASVPSNLQATQRGLFSEGPYRTFPQKEVHQVNTMPSAPSKSEGKQGNLITPGGNISKTALPPKKES